MSNGLTIIISKFLFDQRFLFQEVPSEALKQTKALMRLNLSGESPVSVLNVKHVIAVAYPLNSQLWLMFNIF